MRRLLFILLTIFSLGNIAVHAEKVNDCIKIVLQQTVPGDYIPPINKEGGPVVRSIYMPIVDAYLYNNVVNVKTLSLPLSLSPTKLPVKRSIQRHVVILLLLI